MTFPGRDVINQGVWGKWTKWIVNLVKGGSLAIRLNDENNPFFKPGKGLR
jgi:hypothetical protein